MHCLKELIFFLGKGEILLSADASICHKYVLKYYNITDKHVKQSKTNIFGCFAPFSKTCIGKIAPFKIYLCHMPIIQQFIGDIAHLSYIFPPAMIF